MRAKSQSYLKWLIALLLIAFLSGCADSGGDSEEPSKPLGFDFKIKTKVHKPGGYWEGYLHSEPSNQDIWVIALSTDFEEFRIIDNLGSQFFGTPVVSEVLISSTSSPLSGNFNGVAGLNVTFADGSKSAPFTLNGHVSERDLIWGDWEFLDDNGTFDLSFNTIYNRDSSLDLLTGVWFLPQINGVDINLTLNIQSDGTITGTDGLMSTWNGTVEIIDSEYNMYRVNLTETPLGFTGQDYTGLMALIDVSAENDAFLLAANHDDMLSLSGVFIKQ